MFATMNATMPVARAAIVKRLLLSKKKRTRLIVIVKMDAMAICKYVRCL